MMRGTFAKASFMAVALLVAAPTSAFAYIDPGSGSLLLQIVMSAIFGGLFMARNFLAKAAVAFRRILSGNKAESVEKPPTPPETPVA